MIWKKNAALPFWQNQPLYYGLGWLNIIDTPGHADFGGEVERVLHMADGVILLVDAAEGPMPQTKFVLGKALAQGLRPIVIINKVDKPDARSEAVVDEVFDLFVALDANDEQLDFPILYASGRDGWCVADLDEERSSLAPLLDVVVSHVPPPSCLKTGNLRCWRLCLILISFLDAVLPAG